jgi:hypothetical protein
MRDPMAVQRWRYPGTVSAAALGGFFCFDTLALFEHESADEARKPFSMAFTPFDHIRREKGIDSFEAFRGWTRFEAWGFLLHE